MSDYSRKPCPHRIINDCGAAFTMGLIGGSIFHGIKGFRNAPSGLNKRLAGSLSVAKAQAPIKGVNFATWGLVFSTLECSLIHLRRKEDPWNAIISGAATSGILASRKGISAMAGSAIISGICLGLYQGMDILCTRLSAEQYRNPLPMQVDSELQKDSNKSLKPHQL